MPLRRRRRGCACAGAVVSIRLPFRGRACWRPANKARRGVVDNDASGRARGPHWTPTGPSRAMGPRGRRSRYLGPGTLVPVPWPRPRRRPSCGNGEAPRDTVHRKAPDPLSRAAGSLCRSSYRASRQASAAFRPSSRTIRSHSRCSGVSAALMIAPRSTPASTAARNPATSMARLSIAFVGAITSGGVRASRSASTSTSSARRSAGTTRLTSPMRRASWASMRSPVSSSSRVAFWPTRNGIRSVTGAEPYRISGSPSCVPSAATTRSQAIASSSAPARQYPWTCAITGFGQRQTERVTATSRASTARQPTGPAGGCSTSSFRSYPAEKARPAPAMATTRTRGSAAASAIAASSEPTSSSLSALSFAGRLSTRRTPHGVGSRRRTGSDDGPGVLMRAPPRRPGHRPRRSRTAWRSPG